MFRTVFRSVEFVLGVSGLLFCSNADGIAQSAPVVGVMTVQVEDVSPGYEFVGRVEALNAVDIRARIEGFLENRSFAEGQNVEKDQDLFTLERMAYELALQDAQAALVSAQTTLDNDERQFQRNQALRSTVSQAVLEASQAARDTARANVLSAQARVNQAELNLGYTRIKAPIGGRIGRAAFSVGSLVGPSSEPLARVVQIDPIRVVFSVSDRTILDLRAAAGGAEKDALAKRYALKLRLSNDEPYQQAGKVEFFGNEVDVQTGTLPIRALFDNPQSLLMPGQFVTVIVEPADRQQRPVVPIGSVEQDRDGRFVLVVDGESRATVQRIRVSTQLGQNWVVEEGLKGGETLIVQGLQRVSPGAVVEAQSISAGDAATNAAAPTSASAPGSSSQ
ncbi:hemolysin secretion protein D [Sinorhizobium fredii USDA 205]|uniref:Efflux RND transporter periplasmic adaptor subunit n=1 Tax=Rhizobium fredii TaxID=380 RepID=A0A2A6LZY6_RHIFR|nr:efflux RND transporter periplasmic adaptor subunit [Sinorhizobium fredii]AWM26448.1 RND efflux system membrane fusion protein CmeA [Sinorhizobium fredii CCBAU 25509]KSV89205.1 hemolysin secretion protein D [Sinorhizobium fredii USDA 205]MCG5474317.1 efflux RND transporter periplasmic adaptor subunit [Sinorhizobium fredii]MQW97488.1 efflux RND transporter periplasmic adaptor subunit [Sinorhizobium fredii]MQX12118.1 efflux RND transporter periplasmic adaptor subunit [Sinorhizobium fredii]